MVKIKEKVVEVQKYELILKVDEYETINLNMV